MRNAEKLSFIIPLLFVVGCSEIDANTNSDLTGFLDSTPVPSATNTATVTATLIPTRTNTLLPPATPTRIETRRPTTTGTATKTATPRPTETQPGVTTEKAGMDPSNAIFPLPKKADIDAGKTIWYAVPNPGKFTICVRPSGNGIELKWFYGKEQKEIFSAGDPWKINHKGYTTKQNPDGCLMIAAGNAGNAGGDPKDGSTWYVAMRNTAGSGRNVDISSDGIDTTKRPTTSYWEYIGPNLIYWTATTD